MLLLLSPAKTLDYETPVPAELWSHASKPHFVAEAAQLIEVLKTLTVPDVAALMDLSEPLSALNVGRFAQWSERFTQHNSKPSVLAFAGDVYDGLNATTLSLDDLLWAQQHLAILSGLYGVLRPLDKLQPYRLEMSTRLANPRGKDLYAFWGDALALHLNKRLSKDPQPVIVNLASQEYFKAADRKVLQSPVVECVFEDWKNGQYKIISFFAKRARGLMARYIITHRLQTPEALDGFDLDGYAFDAPASTPLRKVFRRRLT